MRTYRICFSLAIETHSIADGCFFLSAENILIDTLETFDIVFLSNVQILFVPQGAVEEHRKQLALLLSIREMSG